MEYDGLGYGAGSMRSVDGVRVRSRRAVYILARVDCCHFTVIKSTILLSTSVARRGEIAKGNNTTSRGALSRVEEVGV